MPSHAGRFGSPPLFCSLVLSLPRALVLGLTHRPLLPGWGLQEERDRAREETARLAVAHAAEIKAIKLFYTAEVATVRREVQYAYDRRDAETRVLRARIDELKLSISSLTWTERHAAEASAWGAEEVFCRLLAAQSAASCDGRCARRAATTCPACNRAVTPEPTPPSPCLAHVVSRVASAS